MLRIMTCGGKILALLVAIGAGGLAAPAQSNAIPRPGTVVNTREGPVRGELRNGVLTFLGIPYAAPPVGMLRWKPPAPPRRHGLIDATRQPNMCPQSNTLGVFAGPTSITEDCLYLSIYTTGTGSAGGKLKPVIFWIHGGGNFDGSGSDYDGSRLARGGPNGVPAVVVTLNYRLGLLGFNAHPALRRPGEPFANYGILDQQAALRWLKANAAAFGGDPNRIAVGGQSGGSVDTHAHVVSPLSAGLINRAIFMSAPNAFFVPLQAAEARARAFAAAAGCPGSDAAAAQCLRQLLVPRILQLQGTLRENGPFIDNTNVILDGTILAMQPAEAYAAGKFNQVPVLGGTTADELTFSKSFELYYMPREQREKGVVPGKMMGFMSNDQYVAGIKGRFGPKADKVLAEYPASKFGDDAGLASFRVTNDPIQCSATLRVMKILAARVAAYAYVFTYPDAPYPYPKMPGFRALAAHTIDIQFLFTGYHGGQLGVNLDQVTGMPRGLNAGEEKLSDQLTGFWTRFADTGNPNGPGSNVWPRAKPDAVTILQQDIPLATWTEAQARERYHCAFWESL